MRILVTGTSGQLGMDLVPLLDPHEVVTPDRTKLDITDHAAGSRSRARGKARHRYQLRGYDQSPMTAKHRLIVLLPSTRGR